MVLSELNAHFIPLCFLLQVLADKVHIKALTIAQRVSLLQQGLHDTSGTQTSQWPFSDSFDPS